MQTATFLDHLGHQITDLIKEIVLLTYTIYIKKFNLRELSGRKTRLKNIKLTSIRLRIEESMKTVLLKFVFENTKFWKVELTLTTKRLIVQLNQFSTTSHLTLFLSKDIAFQQTIHIIN